MVNNATKQQGLYTMQDTEAYVVEPVNIVDSLFWPEIDFFFPGFDYAYSNETSSPGILFI